MKTTCLFAVMLGVTAGVAEAAPPTWCGERGVEHWNYDVAKIEAKTAPSEALVDLVSALCDKADGEKFAPLRAKWNQRLGLTDAQWATDVVPYAFTTPSMRTSTSIHHNIGDAISALDAVGQFALISDSGWHSNRNPVYSTDQFGDKLTQAGRLAWLQKCLVGADAGYDDPKPGEFAVCQADFDAFDLKALFAELSADRSERGFARMAIRIAGFEMQARFPEHAKEVKATLAKDEGYAKLFKVADDARKQWAASPPEASLLALMLAMDDARETKSNKAFEGCDEKTWAAFSKAVATLPASRFKDLKRDGYLEGVVGILINNRDAYLAAAAMHTCHARKQDVLDRFLGSAMSRWPGFRGPRSAAFTAMLTTPITLDKQDQKISFRQFEHKWADGGTSSSGGGYGAVSKVKANGDKTVIEFAPKMAKQDVCIAWKDSNRVAQITTSGSVIYDYTCTKYGVDTYNAASAPQTVDTKYAGGIKPKTVVDVIENVVIAVFPKAGAAPSRIVGIEVK